MNTERPHDLSTWDELTESEREKYLLLTAEELEVVKPMSEDQRHAWVMMKMIE